MYPSSIPAMIAEIFWLEPQAKLARMRLELAAQDRIGLIVGIERVPDSALLALVSPSLPSPH